MLLPAQYAWFEPVLIATIVVFIIDLVGKSIGSVSMSVTTTPSTTAPAQTQK